MQSPCSHCPAVIQWTTLSLWCHFLLYNFGYPGQHCSVIEHQPVNQKVSVQFLVRAHVDLGCRLYPQSGAFRRQPIDDSLSSLMFLSLPLPSFLKSINKIKKQNTFFKNNNNNNTHLIQPMWLSG
uniref:Uncharacterized protein n=1 Tax=Pipistrellus kuhlii TaxID=59472 RepID=A0A7J8B1X8_PIPKU|nr:hypothetical protein mPipKuh1_007696 [Pipistrellus kuhlii]